MQNLVIARAEGYDGSARKFRRLVAAARRDYRRDHHRGRRPGIWHPGEHLVFDWTDLGAGLHIFCAVLAWSRWRFVRFAADEQAQTTQGFLVEAFGAAGGVPQRTLTDRMGCLKGGVVANLVIPTEAFIGFAVHCRFTPDWCEACDPQSKGRGRASVRIRPARHPCPDAPELRVSPVSFTQACTFVDELHRHHWPGTESAGGYCAKAYPVQLQLS